MVWIWPYLFVLAGSLRNKLVATVPGMTVLAASDESQLLQPSAAARACSWLLANFGLVSHLNRLLSMALIAAGHLAPHYNKNTLRRLVTTVLMHWMEAYDIRVAAVIITFLQVPICWMLYSSMGSPSPWIESVAVSLLSLAAQGVVAMRKAAALRAHKASAREAKAKLE